MYRWRKLNTSQQEELLKLRRSEQKPWYSPPHINNDSGLYLITAACYEHRPIIGHTPDRLNDFSRSLVRLCESRCEALFAWTVLPNHYHLLVPVKPFLKELGEHHGRRSYEWNGEEKCRGRKVWFNAVETAIKSERHFWASLLYVLHNAVKHQYVQRWQDWPFSNAQQTWDPPEL